MQLRTRILRRGVNYGVSLGICCGHRVLRTIIRAFTHTNFAWECLMSRCMRNFACIGHRVQRIVRFRYEVEDTVCDVIHELL